MLESEVRAEVRGPGPGAEKLLRLENVALSFGSGFDVLRGVSFTVRRGEIVALVGESGCGKTLTALAVLGLLPAGAAVSGGSIRLAGVGDLLGLDGRRRREVRARHLAMIFQEPMSALNPVFSVGYQIGESLRIHRRLSRRAALDESRRLLELVAMPDPDRRLRCYPDQLSGGQLQRAMIAMALASGPDLLLADEPTTALDVTIQRQVIDLLLELRSQLGLTVLLISHDLGVVAQCADRVLVMYCGQIVEEAPVGELFQRPAHPYTRALLAAVPRLNGKRAELDCIPGRIPEPGKLPPGCAFHPRCAFTQEICKRAEPDLVPVTASVCGSRSRPSNRRHTGRCFLINSDDVADGIADR